jgi:tetratricopeptide (TPR) repeat protein
MKKILLIAFVFLIALKTSGSDTLYYSMLRKSIDLAYKDYKLENYRQLANCSERILLVYKNEWLPYYYEAYAYINMGFIETKEGDREIYCDKAQNLLDEAFKIKPDESEIYVLQSMLYYARMSISPMINGPIYLPKAVRALDDAEKLEPGNPRIYYLRGKSTMNTPKFFGGGKEAAIPIFDKALSVYKRFKPKSIIHPFWGEEDAFRLYNECKTNLPQQNSVKQPDKQE